MNMAKFWTDWKAKWNDSTISKNEIVAKYSFEKKKT